MKETPYKKEELTMFEHGWRIDGVKTEQEANQLIDDVCTLCTMANRRCDETVCRWWKAYEQKVKQLKGGSKDEAVVS